MVSLCLQHNFRAASKPYASAPPYIPDVLSSHLPVLSAFQGQVTGAFCTPTPNPALQKGL